MLSLLFRQDGKWFRPIGKDKSVKGVMKYSAAFGVTSWHIDDRASFNCTWPQFNFDEIEERFI